MSKGCSCLLTATGSAAESASDRQVRPHLPPVVFTFLVALSTGSGDNFLNSNMVMVLFTYEPVVHCVNSLCCFFTLIGTGLS